MPSTAKSSRSGASAGAKSKTTQSDASRPASKKLTNKPASALTTPVARPKAAASSAATSSVKKSSTLKTAEPAATATPKAAVEKAAKAAAKTTASARKVEPAKAPLAKAPAAKAPAVQQANAAKDAASAPSVSAAAAVQTTTAKLAPNAPQSQPAAAPSSSPVKAPELSAPAPQVILSDAKSAAKPAVKSPQTNVGTVNLKTIQTAADSAPVSTPTKAVAAPATAPAAAKPAAKPGVHRTGFKAGEHIVYPAHGVGQIIAVEEQEVAGFKLELFVISFAKDKMTLKVPMPKVIAGAIRKLADAETVKKSLDTLTGRARIKRTMWSRRAQEYEAKINSGDLGSIAEVVRDLYRSDAQPEQSYSERQLYESALDRMAREIAVVQKLTDSESLKVIEAHLQKGPKRGSKAEQAVEDLAEEAADGDIEEAA